MYRREAGRRGRERSRAPAPDAASRIIQEALEATSKPRMALAVAEAMADPESPGEPKPLRDMLELAVFRARSAGPG